MGLSIREIMKIEPFSEAKLLAGEHGMDRVAEWANMQEVPDCIKWFYGKEIIFASGFAFKNAQNGVELMRRLDEIEVAALFIKPGEFLDEVPQEMIDYADEIGMPLFQIPSNRPYMDFMVPLYERLMEEQLYVLKQVEQINEALTEEIFEGNGIDGICRVLSQETHSAVAIYSDQGNLLAACPDETQIATIDAVWSEYRKNRSVHDRYLKKNKCNRVHGTGGRNLLCIPMWAGEECLAYMLIEPAGTLPDLNDVLLEKASSMASIELLKEKAALQEEEREKEQLLEDVLLKRYRDKELILMRGKYSGFDFNRRYLFFVIDARLLGEGVSLRQERIHNSMRSKIYEKKIPCLMMNTGFSKITGIMTADSPERVEGCRKLLGKTVESLNEEFNTLHFHAGLSSCGIGLEDIDRCCGEAGLAFRTGISKRNQGGSVSCYTELGALCFLSETRESEAMHRYYEEHFRVLQEYDAQNNSQLIDTLKVYLDCGTNLRLTAEKLFIHKNSVIYRLKKIESLCGVSLSDYQVLFDFQLCLKLQVILEE